MIRFIDLSHYCEVATLFAFYDTELCCFIEDDLGCQSWNSRQHFMENSPDETCPVRHLSLLIPNEID